jgi:flagellar biosynthesis anti-sigma factor FlgM
MEIRNNAEALKTLLGVSSSESAKGIKVRGSEANEVRPALAGDEARLSGIGAAMQSASGQDGVRLEKVLAVQQALAAGTYNVPASKVADKVMDAMLGASVQSRGE